MCIVFQFASPVAHLLIYQMFVVVLSTFDENTITQDREVQVNYWVKSEINMKIFLQSRAYNPSNKEVVIWKLIERLSKLYS